MTHDELWDAVNARQAEVRITMTPDVDDNTLNRAHRRKYLLNGLLDCEGVRRWRHDGQPPRLRLR